MILPLPVLMDSLLQFLFTLISGIIALLIFIYVHHSKKATTSCSVPEVGGAWPIIGHLHLLGGHQLTYRTLAALADKYGPVFTMRLGSHRALVVSNWEMARECFTIHDKAFSTRPALAASKLIGYDYAMFGFAPYGSYWREMRKMTTIELLSNHRLDMLKHILASEVETAIKELYNTWLGKSSTEEVVLVEMKQWFGYLTYNIAFRLVVGKRIYTGNTDCLEEEARRCQELMRDFFYYLGAFVLSDVIPYLGWLDFGRYKKAMKRIAKELDILMEGWLAEHKENRLLGGNGKNERDFMDVMLTILEDSKPSGFDADTINKATCLNLIGGADTNMVPLIWALCLLLNNQHVLKKAQEELDIHVGKDRMVEESDIKNLVYLQAIVKETFRLYPPGPVQGLRAAMEDCTLSNGYHVRAGTRLMVNVWKIQHDERVWSTPEEFQPERFLTSHQDTDVRGQNHELMPFGSGRRACPGISLALQVVHLTLASLLHSFEVAKPSNEPMDMTESPSLSNVKATPLEVLLTPRLNPKLYGK